MDYLSMGLWVKKMPTPTGTTGGGRAYFSELTKPVFFRYPVFLTHSHLKAEEEGV